MPRFRSKAEPQQTPQESTKPKPRRVPRYNVVLWNDEEHSFDYVIGMMRKLFGHPVPQGRQIAIEVDTRGRAICFTTTLEHAELKRDQIVAFGSDPAVRGSTGPMRATIEPVAVDE